MGEQQAVWAERAHFGTHLTKHGLGSVRTCQTSFAAGTLHLQSGKQEKLIETKRKKGLTCSYSVVDEFLSGTGKVAQSDRDRTVSELSVGA